MTEAERFFRDPDLSRLVDQVVLAALKAVAAQGQSEIEVELFAGAHLRDLAPKTSFAELSSFQQPWRGTP